MSDRKYTPAQAVARRAARESGDAEYLASVPSRSRSSEAARLAADRANQATAETSETHRLETYEEAWTRLGLPGQPTVPEIVARGVVRGLVPR